MIKFTGDRPFTNPEPAARKLLMIANATEPVQDGRIHIEKLNGPFLSIDKASPQEYGAGLAYTITKGWLWKFTQAGADLFS